MFRVFYKSMQFLPNGRSSMVDSSSSQLLILKSSSSKMSSSSSMKEDKQQSFTVGYLINECGLSPETAVSVAEKVHFESPERPDSVLALLRNHGFTKTLITRLVTRRPMLLRAYPERTLLPKLEFYRSIGIPIPDLARVISSYPYLLALSLQKQIIPSYNYLKNLVHTDRKVVFVFKRSARVFMYGLRKQIPINVEFLRELGVRESFISFFMANYPTALLPETEKFIEIVNKVTEMGFDPSKLTFLHAIQVFADMTESTWERKQKAYSRWGWSEDEIRLAFLMHPICMNLSEKKITSAMDFLVNKMGCEATAIAKYPMLLFFSLEKRIIPRCLVIKVLMLKSLLKKTRRLTTFLLLTDKKFLEKFITKYQKDVPQIFDVYQRKISLLDLGFGSEEISKIQLL